MENGTPLITLPTDLSRQNFEHHVAHELIHALQLKEGWPRIKSRLSDQSAIVQQPQDNWKLLPDITPAIVDRELFERVQKIRQQDRELHRARKTHEYLLRTHIACGYCGSPLVGSFMNHRYRYYHCRGTYPTAARGKICNAPYIQADNLEDTVWEKVKEVLENPQLILAELQHQVEEQHSQVDGELSLDKEIAKLKRRINNYDSEEKRLIKLFRYGEIDENRILDELNQLKKDRKAKEEQLAQCAETKERLANLVEAEIKLNEYCERVRQNLAECSLELKRLALDALDIQVTVTPERVDIKGVIPIDITTAQAPSNILTTGQTSA